MSDTAPAAAPSAAPAAPTTAPTEGQPRDASGRYQPKPGEAAPVQPTAEQRREWRLKVDRREVVVDSEDKLLAYAQKGLASDRRFEEHAAWKRERDEAEGLRKTDLRAYVRKLGLTREELLSLSEAELHEEVQRRQLSPEQRRLQELEGQLRQREEEDTRRKQTEEEAELERLATAERNRLGGEMLQALEAVGLPQESASWAVKRMATLYRKAEANGYRLSPQQIAPLVREDYEREHRALLGAMPPERLVEFLGKERVDGLMRHVVATLKAKAQPTEGQPRQPAGRAKKTSADYPNRIDYALALARGEAE